MKKPVLAILGIIIAIIVVIGWKFIFPKKRGDDGAKQTPLPVSKHSEGFNRSMMKAMDDYYALTEAFVNWDTTKINTSLTAFKTSVDSLRIPEMQKDSLIYETVKIYWDDIKAEIHGMQLDTSISLKRESLYTLSEYLITLLKSVKYDVAKVYYHECHMALNNYERSAFWLSATGDTKSRRNPYLGLYDPKYGKGMLTCGLTRDSIYFSADTTGK